MANQDETFTRELIPELFLPEYFRTKQEEFALHAFSSMKKQGEMIKKTGRFNLVDLPDRDILFYCLVTFRLEANEIISSLNFILTDMDDLSREPARYPGKPYKRMTLLMELYFFKFFIFKEKLNKFLQQMERHGVIDNTSTKKLANTFYGIFNDVITLRNKIVHESVSWPGEEHLILILASMLDDMDLFTKHKETGEPLTVEDALRNFYNVWCPLLNTEGHQVSRVLQEYINVFSKKHTHRTQ